MKKIAEVWLVIYFSFFTENVSLILSFFRFHEFNPNKNSLRKIYTMKSLISLLRLMPSKIQEYSKSVRKIFINEKHLKTGYHPTTSMTPLF